ncbi:MAG: hypothetical protein HC887_04850 [Desulfobacteraceae bacterium]|nr:hypothetical protein [Desulfobacteraceae bacterium]
MKTITLNIDDSIFDEVIAFLTSYPKKKLRIMDNNATQEDFFCIFGRFAEVFLPR